MSIAARTKPMIAIDNARFLSHFEKIERIKKYAIIQKTNRKKNIPQYPGISIPGKRLNVIDSLLTNRVVILKNITTNRMGIKWVPSQVCLK